ncbi:MAG: hypothetical protein JXR69_05870 [Candidatus Delongbacteria bacterium]|nr:hypothetical protein [Candidatus Delongbacteria bacterium]
MTYKPSIIQIENSSRITFTYDNSDKEICNIKEKYISEKLYPFKANLFNDNRVEYEYDSNGNLLNELYQTWNNNAWENTNKIRYLLDDNGNILKVLWQLWIGNEWANSARTNYTLDYKGNRIKEIYEIWTDDSWKDSTRTNCTLNNDGKLLIETSEQFNNDKWTNSIKTEYTYDNDGNLQSFKKFVWDYYMKVKWDKPSWKSDYIKTDTYDHNKRLINS